MNISMEERHEPAYGALYYHTQHKTFTFTFKYQSYAIFISENATNRTK
jgi:hypothetical protein